MTPSSSTNALGPTYRVSTVVASVPHMAASWATRVRYRSLVHGVHAALVIVSDAPRAVALGERRTIR